MKILYLYQYFSTPKMAGGLRSYEAARRLVRMGHEVHMITSKSGDEFTADGEFSEDEAGIHVHWLEVPYSNRMSYGERIKAFFKFAWRAGIEASHLKGDVVFATSTPLTIALPAIYAAKRNKVPMVLEIRDLWPEVPIAVGALKNPVTIAVARWLERFSYRNSAYIIALSPGMKEGIVATGYPEDRVTVIPNSCDLELFEVDMDLGREIRQRYDWLKDRPLVIYAGTLGLVNGVDYFAHLASEVSSHDQEIRFAVIGTGREDSKVRAVAEELGVLNKNFFMIPVAPKYEIAAWLSAADLATSFMHVLRNVDREQFHMDFLVHADEPGAYDDEICSLGSNVIPCMHPSHPLAYARNFKRILREHGPYDVIHSHVHYFSGYVMRLAYQARIPIRIAHSHLDTSRVVEAGSARQFYLSLTNRWIKRYSTIRLAASREAASALFGRDWSSDTRCKILYCAIDLDPFSSEIDARSVRAELGIPEDTFVIGHVGRFFEQKNHMFLIDIASEVAKRVPDMRLLLIGNGPLYEKVREQVAEKGLGNRVIFAGVRPDVSRLMLGAMDTFVFPSLYEGLGLALVEAQAAGLTCIISEVIPEEADINNELISRLSFSQPASVWAEAIIDKRDTKTSAQLLEAAAIVEASVFNIKTGVRLLIDIYSAHFLEGTTDD